MIDENAKDRGEFEDIHAWSKRQSTASHVGASGVPEGWVVKRHEDGWIFFGRPDGLRKAITPREPLHSDAETLHMLLDALLSAAPQPPAPQAEAAPATAAHADDPFNGDDAHLVRCIEALLALDASGSLVPHGVVGHARTMLKAAVIRLAAAPTPVADSGAHGPLLVRAGLIGLAKHVRAVPAYSKLVGDMEVVDRAIELLSAAPVSVDEQQAGFGPVADLLSARVLDCSVGGCANAELIHDLREAVRQQAARGIHVEWQMVIGDWKDELVALHGPQGHIISGLTVEQARAIMMRTGGSGKLCEAVDTTSTGDDQ